MKNHEPKVSVIIPTYNRKNLVIKSIKSVLNQTFKDFELIIVDDGSTDATSENVKNIIDERVKYIRHEQNMGPSAARNTGIKAAKGEWIAFQDSDDVWLDTKLEKQMKVAAELSDDYAVVHCGIQYVDLATGKYLTRWIVREDINTEIINNLGVVPGTPTMVIRKKVFDDVGYFDESIPSHEESELGLRIAQKCKYKLVDEFLVYSTRNHNQITSNNDLFIKAKERIIEKHKNILSKKLIVSYSIIIASDSIIKGDFNKAKKYFLDAFKNNAFRIKTLLSYLLLSISPKLIQKIYVRRHRAKGLI